MTYTAHDPRLFYAPIVSRLASSTGKQIGEGIAPDNVTTPYAVVHLLPDVAGEGSLTDPHQVAVWGFQVNGLGKTLDEATWMQHKIRVALLGWAPTVAGLGTTPIRLDSPSGVIRDDDLQPPLFYSTDRFAVFTSS